MKIDIYSVALFVLGIGLASPLLADILPPGHKSFHHRLVFENSAALAGNRIVAAPTAGFSGIVEVEPDVPFNFSSKYGTDLYVVPEGAEIPDSFDQEIFEQWPSTPPPCSQIQSVPFSSPVASALTTLRLNEVTDDSLVVEQVSHVEFTSSGTEATPAVRAMHYAVPATVLLLFLVFAGAIWNKYRTKAT